MRKAHQLHSLPAGTLRLLAIGGVLALLTACGDDLDKDADAAVDDTAAVSGEVLKGSVSDAMLPLDELRSRAPQAVIVPEGATGGAADAAETGDGEPSADAEEPADPENDSPAQPSEPSPEG